MSKSRNKLVPHELRPANTAQSTIEQNRLSSELKKLDRDKNISISQLAASQAVLQKSLRVMVTGGQRSAMDVADTGQTGPSPVPSLLNPNGGSSHFRVDGTPQSGSRINIIMADPDVLATKSTKSFSSHIISGQAQLVRKLESNRNMRPSQTSIRSSVTQMSRSSMGMIMDGSLYNVPEKGSVTNVQFTEEDVEQGVHEHNLESALSVHQDAAHGGGTGSSLGVGEVDVIRPVATEAPVSGEPVSEAEELQLEVPNTVPAPRSEPVTPEPPLSVTKSPPDRSMPTSRPETPPAPTRALGRLSRTSRTSTTAHSIAPSPPVFPATISQQAYMRAVERAFAAKCLKHSKFVTDLEMNEFVTKYLLIEQQNENFKRANEFVNQIENAQMVAQ